MANICTNCKYCYEKGYYEHFCTHPEVEVKLDVVTGHITYKRCNVVRQKYCKVSKRGTLNYGNCLLFSEKEIKDTCASIWNFIKNIFK